MSGLDVSKLVKSASRAIPMIYAYTTPEIKRHDGWTKIGYTEQDVDTRIRQQTQTADIEYHKEWQGSAIYDDGSGDTFRDTEFHGYLRKLDYENTPNTEWFHVDGSESYERFIEFKQNRGILDLPSAIEYHLRAEQEQAIEETSDYAELHENGEFLWNAKPRFGKTLTAYDLCKVLDASTVLIVTNRPAIANSWYDDYVKFLGLESGYHFISNAGSLENAKYSKTREEYFEFRKMYPEGAKKFITFVSLQDLKGSIYFGGKYKKLEWLTQLCWDILIIDEAHEGVDTFKTDVAFDHINRKFTLHLSGTPFKALANDKFPANAIFNWTYADEQQAKRDWDDPELPNPYADLPKLNMFTYQMSDIIAEEVSEGVEIDGETVEYAFDLNEFFKTNENGNFIYNADVDRFLEALTIQKKFPFSTPELRDELKHTLWMLNYVDSARALAKKLKKHPVFGDYEIVLAAGDGKIEDVDEVQKSFDKVKAAIAEHDKTITLSVGQLTTGVTIPEWTAVLMLSNMKSPSLYMQAAFRAQNPCLFYQDGEYLRKENAYVFDFDPARTLDIFEQFANDLYSDTAKAKGDLEARKKHILTLLNFFPVYGEDEEGEMIELDAEKVLSVPRKIRSQEVVRRGFMSDFLFQNISNVFHAPAQVIELIQNFEPYKAPDKDLGITDETAEELSLNADGEVEIPQEVAIGQAADLFGDKVYGEVEEELGTAIEYYATKFEDDSDEDELIANLSAAFASQVTEPLVEAAKQNYGNDLKTNQKKRIERKIKADADITLNREVGDYRIQKNIIERERADALAMAETDAEMRRINEEHDAKRAEAAAKLKEQLEGKREELIQNAGADIVREVETAKKEAKKRDIETGIRDHLRGFSRTIPSFLMAYGDDETTLATFEDDIPEEVFKEVTSITIDEFRFLRDGGDYVNEETGETEHFDGNLFDPVVFDDSVLEFIRLRGELANYFDPSIKGDIFDYVPPQKTNQIYTPKSIVRKMVDLFEEENPGCFDEPTHVFADFYMKSGLFITEIITRLFNSEKMIELYPDEDARLQHILNEQVFGIAPTEIIYRIAVNFILGYGEHGSWIDSNFVRADSAQLAKNGELADFVQQAFGDKLADYVGEEAQKPKKVEKQKVAADPKPKVAMPVVVSDVVESGEAVSSSGDDIIDAIEELGLDYIDKRDSGGNLWVIGGREIVRQIAELAKKGAKLKYKEGGGKATKGRDAWWMK